MAARACRVRIVAIDELRAVFDRKAILDAVRQALVDHAHGRVQTPPPTHLTFEAAGGDCHVKSGHIQGAATFAIKIATGFYRNADRGLAASNGFVAVISAETGEPMALLIDEGWLTAWRTAAAVTLSVQTLSPTDARTLGVVGSGLQASLALEWIAAERPGLRRIVWARDGGRATALARQTEAETAETVDDLLAAADVVVTATASRTPLFDARHARRPRLFVGVGADMPGKRELPPGLFAAGAAVVVDDRGQSLDHGDWGAAVRDGASDRDVAAMLGDLLAGSARPDTSQRRTIVDLTGVAATDAAISELFLKRLRLQEDRAQS